MLSGRTRAAGIKILDKFPDGCVCPALIKEMATMCDRYVEIVP